VSQLAKVFQLDWQGFNLRRGAILAVIMGLLIIVGVLPHERRYFLSAIFGALLVAVVDPGGEYAYRVLRLAGFAVGGALVTALGFGIGGGPWGWVVLAAFVATVLSGLAVKYGLHRFVAAYLLNVYPHRRLVLHGDRLLHGGVRGHHRQIRNSPGRGHRPDARRPRPSRRRHSSAAGGRAAQPAAKPGDR